METNGVYEDREDDAKQKYTDDVTGELEANIACDTIQTFDDARAMMMEKRRDWQRFRTQFKNQYVDEHDDTPLAELNTSKIGQIIRQIVPQHMNMLIPDIDRLDFFEMTPDPRANEQIPAEQVQDWCRYATAAIQEQLRDCRFIPQLARGLHDLYITGNMIAMMVYQQDIKMLWERTLNPAYDNAKTPEQNFTVYMENGEVKTEMVERVIEQQVPKRVFDQPVYRYINPLNVFPSELDRHNLRECSAVCFTDTVTYDVLKEGEIDSGGMLYANLDLLSPSQQSSTVTEVDDDDLATRNPYDTFTLPSNKSAEKFRRITFLGKLSLLDYCYGRDRDESKHSDAVKQAFIKKFGCDPNKVESGWETWIIEIVNGIMVRCQPLPYYLDEKPIACLKMVDVPNETFGPGMFELAEKDERILNGFKRFSLMGIMKLIRPMWGVDFQALDPRYQNEQETALAYAPDKAVAMAPGMNPSNVMMPFPVNPEGIRQSQTAEANQERIISETVNFPSVKQGVSSGGETATEVSAMQTNADSGLDQGAKMTQVDYFYDVLRWMVSLNHQYTDAPKAATFFDPRGQRFKDSVSPDVWLLGWDVNITGYRATGNWALKGQLMEKFFGLVERAQASGQFKVNYPAFIEAFMELLNIKNRQFILPPDPPQPEGPKTSASLTLKGEELLASPDLFLDVLEKVVGVEITPEIAASFNAAIKWQQAMTAQAQAAETAENQAQAEQEGGPPTDGGRPSEAGGARDHHAPGEYVPSKATADAPGVAATMGQMGRNPMNSRLAKAGA